MTTIYQFNCTVNETVTAFSTDKTGANIPKTGNCDGDWVLYVDNIIKEIPDNLQEHNQQMLNDLETKGWYITTEKNITIKL